MQEVIIGKEGTQKFPINNSRVSRQHAKITVSDSGLLKTLIPPTALISLTTTTSLFKSRR